MKSIGIVSGAGPYAGIILHQKIIKRYNQLGYINDNDFPLIKHISYPFSSTDVNGVVNFHLSQKELVQAIKMCDEVEKIALACNTLLPSLSEKHKKLVFDPRETLKDICFDKQIVVLASVSSVKSELYSDISKKVIYPSLEIQSQVNQVINKVMQGNIAQKVFEEMIIEVKSLYPQSLILLGCTELCVFDDNETTINILDIIAEDMI